MRVTPACDAVPWRVQLTLVPPSAPPDAGPSPAGGSLVRALGLGPRVSDPRASAAAPGAASLARLLGSSEQGQASGRDPGGYPAGAAAAGGGWAERAGVLRGWGMRGVAWALLSDAPAALLDMCLPLARAPPWHLLSEIEFYVHK